MQVIAAAFYRFLHNGDTWKGQRLRGAVPAHMFSQCFWN